MSCENLISRLSKVKKTGPGRWQACCPAHDDKSPSMAIKEAEDGRILIHCFGGCSIDEILGAVGLTVEDLFPERIEHKGNKLTFNPADILRLIARESLIIANVAASFRNTKPSEQDIERAIRAADTIQKALTITGIEQRWQSS